jgi:cytochrome c
MARSILGLLTVLAGLGPGRAQLPFGIQQPAVPPAPAVLFRNQCGTCHTTDASAPPRQGPNLAGVYQRGAGKLPGFKYSVGFASQDFVWDEAHLDAWLTNPQAMIPGTVMVYHQPNPDVRRAIIGWLKEQH